MEKFCRWLNLSYTHRTEGRTLRELNHVPLSALRAVEAVARLGGLRGAADEIGVSEGTVSQAVIKAEARLGHALFLRHPKGNAADRIGRGGLRGTDARHGRNCWRDPRMSACQ